MAKNRNANLDVIRCLATFLVVAVHFFLNTKFYDVPINTWQLDVMVGVRTVCMICVPLFMCLTGYLMNHKELSFQFYRKLLPTLLIYVEASLVVYLARVWLLHEKLALDAGIAGIFDYSTAPYAWYVEMYVGLYLLIPFLNMVWRGCQTRGNREILVATMVGLCILPTFFNMFGKIIPDYWVAMYPLAYYFSGAYINTYENTVKQIPLKLAMLVFVVISVMQNLNASAGRIFQWLPMNDYGSYQVYFLTVIVFIGVLKAKIPQRVLQIAQWIAPYTLAMYLVSYICDQLIYPVFMRQFGNESTMLAVMLLPILAVFTGSLFIAFVQEKLFRMTFKLIKPVMALSYAAE